MRIVVSSGGTAGHIYPALAVTEELLKAGHEVLFAGTPNSQEERLITALEVSYTAFEATGLNRSNPLSVPSFIWRIAVSTNQAKKWLDTVRPDVVAGFGGYASVPVSRAATQRRIPLLIHEQNSTAGWANRLLSKKASAVALTYAEAGKNLTRSKTALIKVTGNPVRRALLELDEPSRRSEARAAFRSEKGIPLDSTVLMVFGGSQGARSVNEAVLEQAQVILSQHEVHVIHITGPKQFSVVNAQIAQEFSPEQALRWHTIDYCTQMGEAYVSSDLVLSRAGASSLAEIAALGMPALLIPYPYATNDHQSANARSLVAAGAARCVADFDLDKPVFVETLLKLLTSKDLRDSMSRAARSMNAATATQNVIGLLLDIAP